MAASRRRRPWRTQALLGAVAIALYLVNPFSATLVAVCLVCGVIGSFIPREREDWGISENVGHGLRTAVWIVPMIVGQRMDLGWFGYFQTFAFLFFGDSLRGPSPEDPMAARLQAAIESRDTAAAKALIDAGADVNKRIAGETALGWAVLHHDLELIQYLLARGANIRQRTGEGDLLGNAELGRKEAANADEKRKYDEVIAFLKREMATRGV